MVAVTDYSKNKHRLFSSNSIQRSKHLPSVPEYVCVQVREVLLSYPNGIRLTYFPVAYQKRFGHYLQLMKFGTSDFCEFISQIYGVNIISRNGNDYVELSTDSMRKNPSPADNSPPGFSRHGSKPSFSEITKQNITRPTNANSDIISCTPTDRPTSPCLQSVAMESPPLPEDPLACDNGHEEAGTDVTLETPRPNEKNITWLELLDRADKVQDTKPENNMESPPSTPGTSVSKSIPPPIANKPLNQAARLAIYKYKHGQDMSSRLSGEISTLLAALPPRIPLDKLVEAYKVQFGFDIPFREFGFSSCQDLIQSLWQTCKLETKENEFIVSAVYSSDATSTDPVPIDEFISNSHMIPPEISDRVRNLLLRWPSGMPISLLQEKFMDAYREPLPYLELGFVDVYEMMISIPDYVLLIPRNGNGNEPSKNDYILQGIPQCNDSEECIDQLLPQPQAYSPLKRDVMLSYSKQPIPNNWEFKVYVPFISNPDRFWIQIVGPMTSGALEDNLEEITKFFDMMNQENKLEYLLSNPVEGQNCAAPYQKDGYYYRSKILRIPFPDQAEVYYVDYGNKSRVPLGSLRQLKNGHMVLPAQAIPCRLANVRPVDGLRWATGSAHKMKDLTNNIELFCKVQNVEPDDTLSVHLYRSNSDNGISINHTLINCGIACYEENNTPLNPSRACMTPEESYLIHPYAVPTPQLQNMSYQFPPQQLPYNQPPPPLPLPYPHNVHYYPMHYPYPGQNQFTFSFPPANPYAPPGPPYPQPPLPPTALVPPPMQPPPQAPARPTANFQLASRLLTPSSPPKTILPSLQDSYIYNDRDNQILGELLKEKENRLCEEEPSSSEVMGTFEKVHKFLLTSTSPEEIQTQKNTDKLRLEQLKSQQQDIYSKGVDIKDRTAFDNYLTRLQNLAAEISELENKLSQSPTSPGCNSISSPQLPPPTLPTPPLAVDTKQAITMPPLANLQLVGRGRISSVVRPQYKYKGIGRGGKMSDLV